MSTTTTEHAATPTPEDAAQLADAIEHFNGSHPDTVAFVAGHVAGADPVLDAELLAADYATIAFSVTTDDGTATTEWTFPEPVGSVPEVQAQLFGLLVEARAADPDGELTSMEREMATTGSLPTTHVTVSAARMVTPWLRQLTLAGITPPAGSGGDEFVLVILPESGHDRLPPGATMQSLRDRPVEDIPPMAYYTVRAWHPETEEVDIWCVLHDHAAGVSGWAASVEPGAHCALWGPREGFAVGDASTVILAVDETGIPAAFAVAEEASADVTVRVIAEVPDDAQLPPVPEHARLTIDWRSRDHAPAGTTSILTDAVAEMSPPTGAERDGLLVLAAAESKTATAIRKLVRHTWGLPSTQVSCVGYWRLDADT